MAKARQQYFADEISLQKDSREFAIADDVQQKIDSIEEGAQVNVIETVKVNGTALTPDANKAVDIDVPDVIDNLYTTSSDDALSANQGKLLYDYIQNLSSRGRFLSNWNTATGLPTTNPSESPYTYRTGDYYIVSNVAPSGGTDYRPNGSQYVIGQASTTVETETVAVSDIYLYDGTNWLLLSNSGRAIAIDSSLSTTSTNPVENRVITNELNKKYYGVVSNTAPSNPAEGMLWYDTTNDILKTYDGANWNEAGTQMVVLSYGNSTWNDFITAYQKNAVVYCRASNQADPGTGSQTRMAFMAYVNNATTPTEVEFQYYRSRADHNSAANQLDQVFVYKLTSASGGTWTVTERNTAAKATAGTGISLTYGSGNMTIANTGVTSFNGNTGAVTYTAPVTSVNGQTGAVTVNDVKVSAAAPSSPTEGMVWYDTTNDQLKVYDGSNWDAVENEYNAGEGISIGTVQDYSAMQGPCDEGFHVPTEGEWSIMANSLISTFGRDPVQDLKMPLTGYRSRINGAVDNQGSQGDYWSATYEDEVGSMYYLEIGSYSADVYTGTPTYGRVIRPFKDEYVSPDNTWTIIQGTLGNAGIFRNQSKGLISITDGSVGYTIADKNLGATQVYNYGDTLSEANCGKYYQWGNNYGFPRTGSVTTSSTLVDASNYGPGNYYSSSTFITNSGWDSSNNANLRGGETGVVTLENAITNTGVLSVNGQTGDVVIQAAGGDVVGPSSSTDGDVALFDGATGKLIKDSGVALSSKADASDLNTKTFYLSSTSDLTTAQAALDWYLAGKNPIISFKSSDDAYTSIYILQYCDSSIMQFLKDLDTKKVYNSYTSLGTWILKFFISSGTVTSIQYSGQTSSLGYVLDTNTDYSTPYTPQYNGSPATKKYVDDHAFSPTNTGNNGQVLMKGISGYYWSNGNVQQIEVGAMSGWVGDDWTSVYDAMDGGFTPILTNLGYSNWLANNLTNLNSGSRIDLYENGEKYEVTLDSNNEVTAVTRVTQYMKRFNYNITDDTTDITELVEYLNDGGNACIWDTTDYTAFFYINYGGFVGSPGVLEIFHVWSDAIDFIRFRPTLSNGVWALGQPTNEYSLMPFSPSNSGSTGQVLTKTAAGYNWADSGVNTKTFYLSSTSDLTNAQAALDWYLAGKNPIIVYSNCAYNLHSSSVSQIGFEGKFINATPSPGSYSIRYHKILVFNISSGNVTSIADTYSYAVNAISPGIDYQVPYTPTYDGSPATKKYVDDSVANAGIAKIFTLSGTGTGATVLAEAQDVYDWYDASKEPIVDYNGRRYHLTRMDSTYLYFTADYVYSANYRYAKSLKFTVSSGSVTNVELFEKTINITTSVPSSGDANTIYFVK